MDVMELVVHIFLPDFHGDTDMLSLCTPLDTILAFIIVFIALKLEAEDMDVFSNHLGIKVVYIAAEPFVQSPKPIIITEVNESIHDTLDLMLICDLFGDNLGHELLEVNIDQLLLFLQLS